MVKQQKPKPTYCKVCGSLDIYNGEHDMCRAIDVARQQTALALHTKFVLELQSIYSLASTGDKEAEVLELIKHHRAKIKKLSNSGSVEGGSNPPLSNSKEGTK